MVNIFDLYLISIILGDFDDCSLQNVIFVAFFISDDQKLSNTALILDSFIAVIA